VADAKTPRERAEALFTIGRHEGAEGVSWIVRDARGVPLDRCGTETSARTSVRWRAEPIAAAIEAAARDATEAAAAVCDRIMAHEDRAALEAREALNFEARDRHWHRRDAAHECGWAIRKGDAGGEHGR